MPSTLTPFDDLPILTELREELSRAYSAHESLLETRHPRQTQSDRSHRLRRGRRLGPARRPMALAGGGAGIAIAAVAAVLLWSPATQPAYALTQNADGTVTVTIHDVEAAAPALNAKLAAMGIDERIVPVEANCPTSGTPSVFDDPMFADPQEVPSDTFTFTPGRGHLAAGYTGVMAAEQLPNGEIATAVEAIDTPVPSCFPTTVYTLHQTGTTANGTPIYQATPGDTSTTTTGS